MKLLPFYLLAVVFFSPLTSQACIQAPDRPPSYGIPCLPNDEDCRTKTEEEMKQSIFDKMGLVAVESSGWITYE